MPHVNYFVCFDWTTSITISTIHCYVYTKLEFVGSAVVITLTVLNHLNHHRSAKLPMSVTIRRRGTANNR